MINGEENTFGVSGKLIRNVLVMYDRETESLWSQLLGEAVSGDLQGTKLEYLPSIMTTWEEWQKMHPDTLAIVKGYSGNRDPYLDYYRSNSAGVIGRTTNDERLATKEFVVGVSVDEEAIAFPFSVLNEEPVVNDEISDLPIVVVFDPAPGTGAVWEREMADGEVLNFVSVGEGMMEDVETGSLWDGIEGVAVAGELEGTKLTAVKSTLSFWFGWVDFYPDTRLYGVEE